MKNRIECPSMKEMIILAIIGLVAAGIITAAWIGLVFLTDHTPAF